MSTSADTLHSIEQRAERALPRELRRLIDEVLGMRSALILDERAYADALLMKLDRLITDQTAVVVGRPAASAQLGPDLPPLDFMLPRVTLTGYEVRFFDRHYGDLEDVAVVASFALAVQLALDRAVTTPKDTIRFDQSPGRSELTILTVDGSVLLLIRSIERPFTVVEAHVAKACHALEQGEPSLAQQLFAALKQAA